MRRSLRTNVLALVAASFLAFFEIFRTTVGRLMEGNMVDAGELFRTVIPMWITVVLASPWCAFMARRFPFRGERTGRTILTHVGGAAVFVAIHMALLITMHHLQSGAHPVPFWPGLIHRYFFYVVMEMSVYAAIVMVLLLVEAHREASERAVSDARLSQSLTAARLESLQAQIRPHFLFNTLNALAVLSRRGDGAAVDRAIGDLGELLRASFDADGRHEIRLGEEIEFLERYVSLQRIRFPDRLVVEWEVADESRNALVPALLVQPLLENSIEHGLSRERGGRVRVGARRDDDMLEVDVSDDGPGFAASPEGQNGGVGLANTRERLALLYGDRGTLTCGDREGGGGLVRIRLPWRVAAGSAEVRGGGAGPAETPA